MPSPLAERCRQVAAAAQLQEIREALDRLQEELHLDGRVERPSPTRGARVMKRFRG